MTILNSVEVFEIDSAGPVATLTPFKPPLAGAATEGMKFCLLK